jgi:hypothetical protein
MRLRHLFALLPLIAAGGAMAEPDDYVDIARGKALVTAGDCVACHTAPGGAPFAGGLPLQTPFGVIMTPNITPDNATGIGSWSANDLARAMHEGRRRGGTYLHPAFPIPITPRFRAPTMPICARFRRSPDGAQHHQRHACGSRQMVGRRYRAISEDRPDPLQPRQRTDEGCDREFDLEDAGRRLDGDRGLSEGARRSRLASAYAAGFVRSAHAGRRGDLHRYLLRLSYA